MAGFSGNGCIFVSEMDLVTIPFANTTLIDSVCEYDINYMIGGTIMGIDA